MNENEKLLEVESWNMGVRGDEAPPLINTDAELLRTEAGPGTGKTFALMRRVERLLHPRGENLLGSDVLIVAFNRIIAKQLRSEIEARLVQVGIDQRPTISTVHALCLQVIGDDVRLIMPHESEAMLYDILNLHPAIREEYNPRAHQHVSQALRDHEAGHQSHEALWQAVRKWLVRHNAALISDLPPKLLHHIKAGDFGDVRYKHVIVDEFQDLTAAEQELFFKLKHDDGNFFGLGDSRQSIYAFRGNDRQDLQSLELWASFENKTVLDLPMRGCQRCTADIVEAANTLMTLSGEQEMIPARTETGSLYVVHWKDPRKEAEGMAANIVSNIRSNPRDRHLVMVTRRKIGYWLRDAINEIDDTLEVDLSFEEGLLEHWPVRQAFIFLTLLFDPDAPSWRAWLGYKHSNTGSNYKAPERNSPAYINFLSRHDDCINEATLKELTQEKRTSSRGKGGINLWDRATKYFAVLDALPDFSSMSPHDIVRAILDDSLWITSELEELQSAKRDLKLLRDKSVEIVNERIESGSTLPMSILAELAKQLRYKVAVREAFNPSDTSDLQVTTLWGAEGVTADHVYVLGLCDEALPGEKRDEYPGTESDYIDEQRRLFYVTITRSKQTLVLSRPRKVSRSEALQLGLSIGNNRKFWIDLRTSRFLRDIQAQLPDGIAGSAWSWKHVGS